MLKKPLSIFFLSLSLLAVFSVQAQQLNQAYQFSVDLNQVENDMLEVCLVPPKLREATLVYNMPRVVPGTYSISDFGRFIQDFKAYDRRGRELEVSRLNSNQWEISRARRLRKICYKVEDTWDSRKENFIFEPAGTNIEANKHFMLNTFGFFGYFEGFKQNQFVLNIEKPTGFYGSTALQAAKSTETKDVFEVDGYVKLADSPLMYCLPDTAVFKMSDAEVLVSIYSPNRVLTAAGLAEEIGDVLEAQKAYLGGTLPVDRYAFLIYLTDKPGGSGMMGALEHANSSVYFLPEIDPRYLSQSIRDIAAHEFFHIVTPLNIRSEEIHDFDFIDPKMSKHLWLYEGVTEYSALHVQVMYDLITFPQYLDRITSKFNQASAYNDSLPFTVMSQGVLDTYKDEYGNVYEKGALIGLALDIFLLESSLGQYGLQELMTDLAAAYGPEQPFKDDELFDEIARISGIPEVRGFFARHVEGPEPLPYEAIFEKVGIRYSPKRVIEEVSMGNILGSIILSEDTSFILASTDELDDFGREMGYLENDKITHINGQELTLENAVDVISAIKNVGKAGDTLRVTVERQSPETGEKSTHQLEGAMPVREQVRYHIFEPLDETSQSQMELRDAWLNPRQKP